MSEGGTSESGSTPQMKLRRGNRVAAAEAPSLREGVEIPSAGTAGEECEARTRRRWGYDRDYLLYDHFKHLTTLALLTLGGVLTLSQTADFEDVKPALIIGVIAIVSLAGATAFAGAGEIVRTRHDDDPPAKALDRYRIAAPVLLSLGVGMFLYLFVDSLG